MKNTFQSQLRRPTGGAFASWSRSRMRSAGSLQLVAATTALTALVGLSTANAADVTFDFDKGQPAGIVTGGNNDQMFRDTSGNPGGFLALTYPTGSQNGFVVFENTDPGKVVTGFSFSADLRVGNPSTDRAADGFSISFAREGDPFLTSLSDADFGGNCCFETGTKTGIAVSFDTWSGNTFPTDLGGDTADIEGIIVRVDNRTIKKADLPTRNGSADDITSLQTGPRDAQYWTDGGDPYDPGSWAGLQWRKFAIDLTSEGKLSVSWKGNKVLDNFQTTYFPTAGQLVFAARTGGANENTHVDNIRLVTIAQTVSGVPDAPANFKVTEAGSRHVSLTWDAATVPTDPAAKVAYTIERDGEVIAPLVTDLFYNDSTVVSTHSYTYKVTGKNIAGNPGASSTLNVTTVADVPGVAFLKAEQWSNISGGTVEAGIADPHYADPPDAVHFVNGLSFGETSNFGNTWGENFLAQITGVLTVPESGKYRFFVRSDDGSALYLNTTGAAIPDPNASTPVATESGCCGAFEEPNSDGTLPEVTSDWVTLTAGQKVGIAYLVKEGGGGDWGQVAWRKEGDTTPASSLTPIRGDILSSPVDAVGATVAITTQPVGATVNANEATSFSVTATGRSFYEKDYGAGVISYQWYKGGVAVVGANAATYNIPVASAGDNNAKVKVVVAVAGKAVTSDEVTLVVNPDVAPPAVTSITVLDAFNSKVVFSEPVKDPSATAVANYTFTGLTTASVVRNSDRSVTVTTSKHTADTDYPVTIAGVLDNADKPSAFSGKIHSLKSKPGALFSRWNNETGGFETFANITRPADSLETVAEFFSGANLAENYFGRLQAIFTPATSGNYVFWCSSDDHGELYLSTDANPTNKKKIAQEPEWSNPKYWIGDGTDADANTDSRIVNGDIQNRSDSYLGSQWAGGPTGPITLTAGTQYYIEFLYKEGGGGDSGSATFVIGGGDPVNGETALKGDLLSWYEAASVAPPQISGITANADGTITITWTGGTLEASPTLGGTYTAVPGATSPYTFTPTEAMLFGRVTQ